MLKVKRVNDGSLKRFKARIVAGGNHQTYGQDYLETYVPVVPFLMVRVFLYFALFLNMCIAQSDVKTAFLNWKLSEDIWIMSPHGISGRKSLCYKFLKAMYGLKQAHFAWHSKPCADLLALGFEELPSAPCSFRRKWKFGKYTYILVYVDDILILAYTVLERNGAVEELKKLYDLCVSERVEQFLGVQLGWELNSDGKIVSLKMSQPLYTEGTLRRFGLSDSRTRNRPIRPWWNRFSRDFRLNKTSQRCMWRGTS